MMRYSRDEKAQESVASNGVSDVNARRETAIKPYNRVLWNRENYSITCLKVLQVCETIVFVEHDSGSTLEHDEESQDIQPNITLYSRSKSKCISVIVLSMQKQRLSLI